MLVDGKWVDKSLSMLAKDGEGRFIRQTSSFRNWVTPDGSPGPSGEGGFPAASGRYHLYASLGCPWASRTLIARKLKKLEDVVSLSIAEPILSSQGWRFSDKFPGSTFDDVNGATYIHEIYAQANPHFTGRTTVPVLWDKARRTIVNNESADILRIFNSGFGHLASCEYDLYPAPMRHEIDLLNEQVYAKLNNGVYRAGFAATQQAYSEAYVDVFDMLDTLESRLGHSGGFLFGDALTEADIRLFVTLVRFDIAYHGIFKCNKVKILEYPALSAYIERVLSVPGISSTVDLAHIKHGYYSIESLNPNGIVPLGPYLPWARYIPSTSQ